MEGPCGQDMPQVWVYLSPHLDDIALSCGGLLWEQAQAKKSVQVWTICAGDPPPGPVSRFARSLQERWGSGAESGEVRRQEDLLSCNLMRASARHFSIPDCIYRREHSQGDFLYPSEESIFGPLHAAEANLVGEIAGILAEMASSRSDSEVNLVCPLALGGHVDHRLTRAAVELIQPDWHPGKIWFYADFPYVLNEAPELARLDRQEWEETTFSISMPGLLAWQRAVAAHASQISTFWSSIPEMEAAIHNYCQAADGVRLWRKIVALC